MDATSALQWTSVSYGFAAIVGHCFPVYLKFSGGKGVATSLGVFVALAPVTTAMAFGVWLLTLLVGGWVSLGSIVGAVSLPLLYFIYHNVLVDSPDHAGFLNPIFLFGLLAAALVVARHHENISRLLSGEEEKFYEPMKTTSDS